MRPLIRPLFVLLVSLSLLAACQNRRADTGTLQRLQIVATLFPVYDMARAIGGDAADVTLLLPPGVEAHGFEPKPDDLLRINRSDIFLYTVDAMEPWAEKIGRSVDPQKTLVLAAGAGRPLQPGIAEDDGHGHDHDHEHGGGSVDPHLWLDFAHAQRMAEAIAAAMIARDPQHAALYRANADRYIAALAALDAAYRQGLADCQNRTLLQGGHFAFGYLARRYNLDYHAATAVSPDAEPTPQRLAELVRQLRDNRLQTVFSEELVPPRLAAAIAAETGAQVLPLSAGHNLSKADFEAGVTFLDLMQRNLANLRQGLVCR